MTTTEYRGYPSWNAWNISLWIANEEPLYRAGVKACRASTTWPDAVRLFNEQTGLLNKYTPDGGKYTSKSIRLALQRLAVPLASKK